MIELALDKNFAEPSWRKRVSGAGTATVSGSVLTCTGAVGEAAFMDYHVPVIPGQLVEVEVYGRLLSGTAGVFLDFVNHNTSVWTTPEKVRLDAADWQRYRLSYRVPQKGGLASTIRVCVGVETSVAGSAQFFAPVVRVDGGLAVPLTIARGLIRVINGGVSLGTNYPTHGVANVARTDATTVTVTLDREMPSTPADVRPLVLCTGTTDDPAVPVVGNVAAGAAPTFRVRWSNGTSFVDISGTGSRYAFFEVIL